MNELKARRVMLLAVAEALTQFAGVIVRISKALQAYAMGIDA